jgi:hypothetical protein
LVHHGRAPQHNRVHFLTGQSEITPFEINEWIHNTLRIPEQNVTMIQVDGIRRQVFVKLVNNDCV